MEDGQLLFVYGTLKRGGSNHHYLAAQRFVGKAQTVPGFQLYELSGYPGMIRDPGTSVGVTGELWRVDQHCLALLDHLEGINEGLYRREPVPLAPPHHDSGAESYVYARGVVGRKAIGPTWTI